MANWPHSLRALAAPNFRRYYIGQAISMVGTWVQSVAVMWLAYRLSGSTWFTGLVGFLTSAPHLFLAPFAGVLGDRVSRRKLLIAVLTLMALQSVALAVLTGMHVITMTMLAGLALFGGVCNAFEIPTRQSIYSQLINEREHLPNAIALNSMLMNGTRLIGPSIGGVLIAAFGETVCFAVNAVSFIAVVGALFRVTVHPRQKRAPSHPMHDLAEGWRYAMGMLPVRRMLVILAAVSFSISPYATLMPAISVRTFHQGAELVGIFIGFVGLGAFIAAAGLARRPNVRGLGKWIGFAAIIAGVGAVGFGLSRHVWLSCAFLMMEGFGMFMTGATCNTIMQTIVDEEKRSRVMSYYTMFFVGIAPIGHYLQGWLADHIGAPRTFLVGGVIALAAGAAFLAQMKGFRSHLRQLYVSRGIIPSLEDTRVANP
ncbi:MAG TPA: MFS transporter [Usitatibacter sp.]|nr:MFS transporter [Usitatibacter sp.]